MTSHSGDWLNALPISSCGLRLDDEAVRVAVAMRLGLNLCSPHQCQCGAQVDARGLHSLVCKRVSSRAIRYHNINDIVDRAFAAAEIPVTKEPSGLSRTEGKRPDGMILIPWKAGKPALWDVTVCCSTADSYVTASAREAGAAAALAATRKTAKYSTLESSYDHSGSDVQAYQLFADLGRRISAVTGDARETSFLFQRISVAVQRFNAVLLHDNFMSEEQPG